MLDFPSFPGVRSHLFTHFVKTKVCLLLQSNSSYDGVPGPPRGRLSHPVGSHPHAEATRHIWRLLQERRYHLCLFELPFQKGFLFRPFLYLGSAHRVFILFGLELPICTPVSVLCNISTSQFWFPNFSVATCFHVLITTSSSVVLSTCRHNHVSLLL